MRDKHYNIWAFRLDENVLLGLKTLKKQTNLSYNLLFKELIENYAKQMRYMTKPQLEQTTKKYNIS